MQHITTWNMSNICRHLRRVKPCPVLICWRLNGHWWQTQCFLINDPVVDSYIFSLFCLREFLYCYKNNLSQCRTLWILFSMPEAITEHIGRLWGWGFYVILTTNRDQPYCRFGFHYLIKSVQQLADSRGCQPGLKAGLWALYKAPGCQLAPGHRRQCWLDGV